MTHSRNFCIYLSSTFLRPVIMILKNYCIYIFISMFDNIIEFEERIGHGDRSLRSSFENNYFITKFSAEARRCGTFFYGGKLRGFIEDEVFYGAYKKHEANGKIQFAANLIRSLRSDLYYEKARLYLLIKLNSVSFYLFLLLFLKGHTYIFDWQNICYI